MKRRFLRKEFVDAAKQGVLKMIAESKDPEVRDARVADTARGFVVVHPNGNRMYFEILEI